MPTRRTRAPAFWKRATIASMFWRTDARFWARSASLAPRATMTMSGLFLSAQSTRRIGFFGRDPKAGGEAVAKGHDDTVGSGRRRSHEQRRDEGRHQWSHDSSVV